MKIQAIKTRIFRENEDLIKFILKYIKKLPDKSILVITSKIVALSEGKTVEFKNQKEKTALIKKESEFSLKTKYVWLTIKDGTIMAEAGIDESNAAGKLILLPKDSFKTALFMQKTLKKKFKIKKLGVLITDSRLLPLRAGVVGVALGYSGFAGIRDYRGKPDIFGRKLKLTRTDVADSLATTAVLCMGEGKEQQPLALITDAPVVFTEKVNKKELIINPKEDLYAPFFRSILKK
jgi:coenzyme F420-0:L-glutamate ligase